MLVIKTHLEQKQIFSSILIDGGHDVFRSEHISASTQLFVPHIITDSLTRAFVFESAVLPLPEKRPPHRERRLPGIFVMVPDKIGGSIRLHLNATRNVR